MRFVLVFVTLVVAGASAGPQSGLASWYGEEHRGKLMANGQPFDPDKLTAASWSYSFGTVLDVTAQTVPGVTNSVRVTVTDRGPTPRLVKQGRVIDLSAAAFRRLADLHLGLLMVTIRTVGPDKPVTLPSTQARRR